MTKSDYKEPRCPQQCKAIFSVHLGISSSIPNIVHSDPHISSFSIFLLPLHHLDINPSSLDLIHSVPRISTFNIFFFF